MKMSYKKVLLTMMLAFGLSGCVGVDPSGNAYTVTVPTNMINSTLAQSFPQSQKTDYGTLVIEKATVLGKAQSDKLAIGTSFTFSNMLIPNGVKGSVALSSGVRYNAGNRGLYLVSPMVDEVKFQNFSLSQYMTPQMRNVIGEIIAQTLAKKPIYNMNNLGTAASFIRGVRVQNGNVLVSVGI